MVSRQNRPKAAVNSNNAPHSTMQLGWHRPRESDTYSKWDLERMLRAKAKADVDRLRFTDRRELNRPGKKWAAREMERRWLKQINEAMAKSGYQIGTDKGVLAYPKAQIDIILRNQNVHDEVVDAVKPST